jgi:uncharacterized protein (DUF1499 family)
MRENRLAARPGGGQSVARNRGAPWPGAPRPGSRGDPAALREATSRRRLVTCYVRMHLRSARRAAVGLLTLILACSMPAPRPAPDEARFRDLLAQGNGSNIAATSDAARDPRLRTRVFALPPGEVRGRIVSAVLSLPRWHIADSSGAVLWVTRTTRIFRFVDDLYILVEARPTGSAVLVRSASRVGRNDFGQNRRNIAELWAAIGR